MACIIPNDIFKDVGIAKINPENQTNNKSMKWDITKVSNQMLYDLFFGEDQSATLEEVRKLVGNPEIFNKIKDSIVKSNESNAMFADLESSTDPEVQKEIGNTIKYRSIALYEISSAMESEANMEINMGVKDPELKKSLRAVDGSRLVNSTPIKEVIGRTLLNQSGVRLIGDPDAVAAVHSKIGNIAMGSLEETGIISRQENSTILNPDYKKENKEDIKKKNVLTLDGYETVKINSEALMSTKEGSVQKNKTTFQEGLDTGNYASINESDIAEETFSAAAGVSRLIGTVNFKAPLNEGEAVSEENAPQVKDLGNGEENSPGITESHRDLLGELQGKRQRINPAINTFMMHLHNTLKEMDDINNIDTDVTLKKLYQKAGIDPRAMNTIFGSFTGSTDDNFKSTIGRSISQENPMLQLVMYYPELVSKAGGSKDFYHHLGIYRTTRLEFLSTFLNEQMDKNFARALVQGHPVTFNANTTLGQSLSNQMLHSIIDESGLDIKQITEKGFDPAFDLMLEQYEDTFTGNDQDPLRQATFFNNLSSGYIGKGMKKSLTSNPMNTIDILGAISDIRKAQKNGGKLKTAYRTKLDAAASGIMLSFMQNAGKEVETTGQTSAIKFLEELGYTKDQIGKKPELRDAYYILLRGLQRLSDDQLQDDKGTFKLMEELASLGIFGSDPVKAMRNLAKPMTMITNYQAGEETAIRGTSEELRESVITHLLSNDVTKESLDKIKSMIKQGDKKFYDKHSVADMDSKQLAYISGVNATIETFFRENLSDTMRTVIDNEMKGATGGQKSRIGKSYNMSADIYMNESKSGKVDNKNLPQLGVLPAMTWHYINSANINGNKEMLAQKRVYDTFMNADISSMTESQFSKYVKDFGSYHFKMLQKYKMPLTSRRQVLSEKNGETVVYLTEAPNTLTASVNTIHGLDAGIFFKSHEDTLAEIKDIITRKEFNGEALSKDELKGFKTAFYNASGMIHDANNADPYYNLVFAEHYRNNSVQMSKDYDVEEQLAMTYVSNAHFGGKFSMSDAKKLLTQTRENRIKKQKALEDVAESYKFFGFDDTTPESNLDDTGTTTQSTEDEAGSGLERKDDFLYTEEGKADLAASEDINGKYDRTEQVHENKPYNPAARFEGDPAANSETTEAEQKTRLQEETESYKALINSGESYWKYDLETSFSTPTDPLTTPRILEFYAEEYIGGEPTGKTIKEKFLPEFPEQYDNSVKNTDLMPYSYFREGVSDFIGKDGDALFFTNHGYESFITSVAAQGIGSDSNMVAYNGENFDHPILEKELGDIGIKWVATDYGYDSMLVSNDAQWNNKDIPNRKLSTVFAGVSTAEEKAHAKKLGSAHSAEVDIYMMSVVESAALNKTEKRNGGSRLYSDEGIYDEDAVRNSNEKAKEDLNAIVEARPELKEHMDKVKSGNRSHYNIDEDIVYLTNVANMSIEELSQELAHEVAHQKTTGFIGAFHNDPDVKFLKENMNKITGRKEDILSGIDDEVIRNRLEKKVFNEPNKMKALLEFIAIIEAEPDVREALDAGINNKAISARIKRLLQKMVNFFKGKNDDIDFDQVVGSVRNIVEAGNEFNKNDKVAAKAGRDAVINELKQSGTDGKELDYSAQDARADLLATSNYRKKVRKGLNYDTPMEKTWRNINNQAGIYTNQLLLNMLVPNAEYVGSMAHRKLMRKSDLYEKTVRALTDIWTVNEPMASMKGYVDRARVGDLYALNIMEKLQMEAEQEMATFETETIAKLKRLMKKARYEDTNGKQHKLTEDDISNLGKATAYAPIFHLINEHQDFERIVNSANPEAEIMNLINELESKAVSGNSSLSQAHINNAASLGKILAKKSSVRKSGVYNIAQMKFKDDEFLAKETMERLVALYALVNTDNLKKSMRIMAQNPDMTNEIARLSNSLKAIADQTLENSTDQMTFRENMVADNFSEPKEFRAIDVRSLHSNEYSRKNGWKVVRQPTGSEYGIVYRDRTRITNQSGAGITENFRYYDIVVGKDIQNSKAENVVKVQNGTNDPYHKIVLTQAELDTIGATVQNPADMLARSYAQMLMIKQTQAARNFITYGDKIKKIVTVQEATKLNKKLRKLGAKDHPWFISIPDGMTIDDFLDANPNIKALYKEPEQLSRIGGFNENIDLVRKDMHDMIVGYEDPAFGNDSTPQKLLYITRKLVVVVKQAWIILSPIKIAADIASNQIILAGYGVPVFSILKNQAAAIGHSASMSKLRTDYVMKTFEMHAETNPVKKASIEAKIAVLKKKIEKHPMAPIVQNGMMQSVSTDILLKDRSVVSGLQEDIEKILNFGLHKGGTTKPNDLSKAILVAAKSGYEVGALVNGLAKNIVAMKAFGDLGQRINEQLDASGSRIEQKIKDKDSAKLLSELLGAPDSEALRLGSYLVQMADIAARYTLYTHLKKNNGKIDIARKTRKRKMSEEEIIETVMEAFVDYKVNMPKEVKMLSDHGILLFPSFWMRIQKVMYSIAKDNPLKVGTGLILAEAMDLHIASYYDSNIFAKFGEIFNAPPPLTDPVDIIIPTALYEQASFGIISF